MRDFVKQHRITAAVEWVEWIDRNPHMADMPAGSRHYNVTLRFGRRRLTVPFSMGPAHTREPEAVEVLDCLMSDASSIDHENTFEDWASELGFDPDSRKAERIYRTVRRQTAKLRQFLGDTFDAAIAAERL